MIRSILCLLWGLIVAGSLSAAQVGGIIATNTRWTISESPYVVQSGVQIAEDATLTIDAGVTVTSASIQVFGRLVATGTESNPVMFRSATIASASRNYHGEMQFEYCDFQNSYIGQPSRSLGSISIRHSILQNVGDLYLEMPIGSCVFSHNIFDSCIGIACMTAGESVVIEDNLFYNNLSPITSLRAYPPSKILITGNAFFGRGAMVGYEAVYRDGFIVATNNYWGTSDVTAIDGMVLDAKDSLIFPGVIDLQPILDRVPTGLPRPAPPKVLILTQSTNVPLGHPFEIRASVKGVAVVGVQWFRDDVPVANATNVTLKIGSWEEVNAGSYTLRARTVLDDFGSTDPIRLGTSISPVRIRVEPASQTVALGASVSISVIADGSPPIAYQWLHNGVVIDGATASAITLSNVGLTDAGNYTAVVSNPAGSAFTVAAVVKVLDPPLLAIHDASGVVALGTSVDYSVSAIGAGPFTYQWYLNDAPLVGATEAVLHVANASQDTSGAYSVTVVDSKGAKSTATVLLSVIGVELLPVVVLSGRLGSVYQIDYAQDVGEPVAWSKLTNITLSANPLYWIDADASSGRRFYRAKLLP